MDIAQIVYLEQEEKNIKSMNSNNNGLNNDDMKKYYELGNDQNNGKWKKYH